MRWAHEALDAASGDRADEAESLRGLAAAERMRGRMKQASAYLREGRERAADLPSLEGWNWIEVARLATAVGRTGDAQKALGKARSAFAKSSDRAGYCAVGEGLGFAALADGDTRAADQRLSSARQAWRDAGQRRPELRCTLGIGLAASASGAHEAALHEYRDALLLAPQVGDRRVENVARLGVGVSLAHLGDPKKGRAHVDAARRNLDGELVDPDVAALRVAALPTQPELRPAAADALRRLGRVTEADALPGAG